MEQGRAKAFKRAGTGFEALAKTLTARQHIHHNGNPDEFWFSLKPGQVMHLL
jgi:hypothetical protein